MPNRKFIMFLAVFLLSTLSANAALMNHTTSEIVSNTPGQGDFTFQHTNELYVGLQNTQASGRYWALVSAGSVGGIGIGKFSIYDKTADASRLVIDTAGNVGIGTISPTSKLHVSGKINASGDICTDTAGGKCLSTVVGSQWTTSGSNIYFSTGNVGIGTTSPTTGRLVVSGGNLDLSTNKVINLAAPTASADAATKGYVDAQVSSAGGGAVTLWGTAGEGGPACPSGWISAYTGYTAVISTASGVSDPFCFDDPYGDITEGSISWDLLSRGCRVCMK